MGRRATIDDRVRQYCEREGMRFNPWEARPWDAHDGECLHPGTAYAMSWPAAQRLRRKILAKLKDEDAVKARRR